MYEKCQICGRWDNLETHHLLNGQGIRRKADKYHLTIRICRYCHNNIHTRPARFIYLKKLAQKKVMQEQGWDKERFIKEFGKNYLED